MQIAKWGNSLAVRLPAKLVQELGLREGDQIEVRADDAGLAVRQTPSPKDILATLRPFRGRLHPSERLGRDAAHER